MKTASWLGPVRADFSQVQRIVLHGGHWHVARQFAADFGAPGANAQNFISALRQQGWPSTAGRGKAPEVQTSLGFTRIGLERARVPQHVLAAIALKAPAFHAGAALRAAQQLGMTGPEAPGSWETAFNHTTLHAVVSLHAATDAALAPFEKRLREAEKASGVRLSKLPCARQLPPPPQYPPASPPRPQRPAPMWVHFGYRDGLSRVGIEGWTDRATLDACAPGSRHAAGEFVLGHLPDRGGSPWLAGPGRRVWPQPLRAFFRDGSFGVLQQIQQDVIAFESFVQNTAQRHHISTDEVKAKLCGRYPDGRRVGRPDDTEPAPDFDYADDPNGQHCPFGAHMRRMNPREGQGEADRSRGLAHGARPRPLLRRGLPYGPAAWSGGLPTDEPRGLLAQFFCASIEDQYEHLVGQWGDRVPLGSADGGGARDPFSGGHDGGDGPFEIPRAGGQAPLRLPRVGPFTQTRGVAYLFYPSAATLAGMAASEPWLERDEAAQ